VAEKQVDWRSQSTAVALFGSLDGRSMEWDGVRWSDRSAFDHEGGRDQKSIAIDHDRSSSA
jgi:hypothetical protein